MTPIITVAEIPGPLGAMLAGGTSDALHFLSWARPGEEEAQLLELTRGLGRPVAGENGITRQVAEELAEYFRGDRREFTVPIDTGGTAFQRAAWEALRSIPYGETRSYGQQAVAMGRAKAVRAVARANGANRIAIIVPCHRVIGANGSLTGYGAGVWRKERLLVLEGQPALELEA